MGGFTKFILYNVVVYFIYKIIDYIFTFLNLYSSKKLGQDLLVMPSDSNLKLIIINIVISSVIGFIALRWIERKLLWEFYY